MGKIDEIRAEFYKLEGEFVEKLADADKTDPALKAEAIVRMNKIFKHATIKGRGRFLDEMRIPEAGKKYQIAKDTCLKLGGSEDECHEEAWAESPFYRSLFEAWPKTNTVAAWWTAPITHLIGTYDPDNPSAMELKNWRDELDSPLAKGAAKVEDTVDDIKDAVDDAIDDLPTLGPDPETIRWLKIAGGVAATAVVGAVVYRIAKG